MFMIHPSPINIILSQTFQSMNSGQKIGMNSAIILKLQKLQKEAPPPPPQKPPPKVEPPKPKEEPIPPPV